MKKFLSLLLVLALLVVLPFGVEAATKYKDVFDSNKTAVSEEKVDDNTKKATYNFYINVLEGAVDANQEIKVKFTVGSAITGFECGEVDGFSAAKSQEGSDYVCTYKPDHEVTGSKELIGTWTITYTKTGDCSVNYSFGDVTGTINPNTGSTISYVVVGLGVLAAAAAFAVSKKKSKLYNI